MPMKIDTFIGPSDIAIKEYRLDATSPEDDFLLRYDIKLQGFIYPKDMIDVIFKKFDINQQCNRWRFADNVIYTLTIPEKEGIHTARILLYKFIFRTLTYEIDQILKNIEIPNKHTFNSEFSAVHTYLFSRDFSDVGISLVDSLMDRLKKAHE